MARDPLALPRGIYRAGTLYQSKNRYYDALHVRWYPALGPTKGFQRKGTSTLTGMARAAIAWNDNSKNTWIGIGTHSNLYVCNRLGVAFDITPAGFTVGRADAVASGGYGSGPYGASTYGTARSDTTTTISDATEWTIDNWGEDLLGVSPDDRKLYEWAPPTTGTPATQVLNSPNCDAVVTTDDNFVFALGTDLGTDDPRAFSWCDQQDNTNWTPGPTNQAGSYALQTAGRLMCGKRIKGGTLLFSSVDAWLIQYIGGTLVHSRDRIGEGCGIASRQAAAEYGTGQVAWMSVDLNFWYWNGASAVPIASAEQILDYIRRDINPVQISKVVTVVNSANFEIEFRYCSASSTEIDRCVIWQFKDDYWNIGRAARTCGVDKTGGLFYPVLVSTDGKLYDHEIGFVYGSDTPYALTGPVELGNGDQIMHVLGIWPDDATVGDVNATFTTRRNPDDTGTNYGPYTLTQKTDIRFSGGMAQVKYTGVAMTDWRVGTPKLDLKVGEGRG